MNFEIVSEIDDIERIARGPSVRERMRLVAQFGRGRWRKLKGTATVRLRDGWTGRAVGTLVRSSRRRSSQDEDKAFLGVIREGIKAKVRGMHSHRGIVGHRSPKDLRGSAGRDSIKAGIPAHRRRVGRGLSLSGGVLQSGSTPRKGRPRSEIPRFPHERALTN